jgi:hypothetical protein
MTTTVTTLPTTIDGESAAADGTLAFKPSDL